MLFKKGYGELTQEALSYLLSNTDITNTSIGGITRSLIEIINRNVADYYDVLDINMAMGFLSTAEGYFLDLIGEMFNITRNQATAASVAVSDNTQKFYVLSGTLHDRIPADKIVSGITVGTGDGLIVYTVSSDVAFSISATEVYVPVSAMGIGSKYNVGANSLVVSGLGISDVYTTNIKSITSGTDTEADNNYRFRIANTATAMEKANEISIRLAALSVPNVADVIVRPYARGIGSYDVIVLPVEGIANTALISAVQDAINDVQACGIKGTAISPTVVPVDIEVKLVFISNTTEYEQETIKNVVKTAIETYVVSIPIGGTFVYNEMIQQIMDVNSKIKDVVVNCYYFREQPYFHKNVEIYWDEIFYPNPDSIEAIRVL